MGKVRRSTFVALVLLLLSIAGCKVSCTTANVSSLKFSKDKAGSAQTKEFAPGDTVYTIATVSNNSGKVTLKFRLFTEKVEGKPDNAPVADADVSLDVEGSREAFYTLSPPGVWPAGRYRVEVAMMYNGEQKDKKADTFTVTGGGSSGGAPPRPPAAPSPAGDDTPEGDEDDSENSSP